MGDPNEAYREYSATLAPELLDSLPDDPRPERRRDCGAMLLLAGWVLLTRGVLLAAYPGEPDSALFPLGLWRWVSTGPLSTRIYDRQFSPGYYWLGAHLAAWLHVGVMGYIPLLNRVSLIAALAAAPLAYALARGYLPPTEAFWATLLWLLSPAVWWLGMEPHPQMLAITLSLAAIWAHRNAIEATLQAPRQGRRPQNAGVAAWWGLAFGMLLAALLIRSDTVFLFAVFFLPWLVPGSPMRALDRVRKLHLAVATLVLLTAASGGFWVLRAVMVGNWRGAPANEPGTLARIAGFLGGLSMAHQLLPFLTAAGLLATLLAVAGWLSLCGQQRSRWAVVMAAWLLPGATFWTLVRGNNVRHVAIYLLPLLWAGAAGWRTGFRRFRRRGRRWREESRAPQANWVAGVAVLALALDFLLPPSPNLSLYPSGNVPASAAMLRRRERQFFALGAALVQIPGGCYLGSYTSPYVLWGALEAIGFGRARVRGDLPVTHIGAAAPGQPAHATFDDVYSPGEFRQAAMACRSASSLEYTASGRRLHPMGLPARWRPW